jgi:hypothetical protein
MMALTTGHVDDARIPPSVETQEDVRAVARRLGVCDELERSITTAGEFFPGPIEVNARHDPEIPYVEYFELRVVGKGALDDLHARRMAWLRATARIAGKHAGMFCLSVDIEE